jgi:hypothetical protein
MTRIRFVEVLIRVFCVHPRLVFVFPAFCFLPAAYYLLLATLLIAVRRSKPVLILHGCDEGADHAAEVSRRAVGQDIKPEVIIACFRNQPN